MKRNLLLKSFITLCLLAISIVSQAQIYLIGNLNNWDSTTPAATLEETQEKGVYEGTVTFVNDKYFALSTAIGIGTYSTPGD